MLLVSLILTWLAEISIKGGRCLRVDMKEEFNLLL